jgi:hypothetical protein
VNRRRRFRDIEAGYTSSSEIDFSEDYHHLGRKHKSAMERRKSARGLGGLSILQAGLAVEITTIGSTINTMSG